VVVESKPDLFQLILAPKSVGGFANLLDGREKQAYEKAHDGNDHEELNERKGFRHGKLLGSHARNPHCVSKRSSFIRRLSFIDIEIQSQQRRVYRTTPGRSTIFWEQSSLIACKRRQAVDPRQNHFWGRLI